MAEFVENSKFNKTVEGQETRFENLLQQISLQEFQAFIRSYAAQDLCFKTDVELYFAYKNHQIDIGKRYKELTRKFIDIFSDRGFIHYQDTFGLGNEISNLLQAGQDAFDQKNLQPAFAIASVVMEEIMQVMPACDDSAANISQTIESAIELIGAVAGAAGDEPGLQKQIFSFLKTKIGETLYYDYADYGYDLYDIFQPLAIQLHQADTVLYFLDTYFPPMAGDSGSYRQEYLHLKKIEFLKATGKKG